jgi:thiol-disulfide isomerase/thioredoxin
MAHRKIGEILVANKQLTPAQVQELLALQRKTKHLKNPKRFGELAVERHMVSPTELRWALEAQAHAADRPKRLAKLAGKLAVAGAVLFAGYKGIDMALAKADPSRAGGLAPAFKLAGVPDGRPVRLADYKGKVLLLNFWATWCPPCQDEIPELKALHDDYGKSGFSVVGVTVFYDAIGASGVKQWVRDNPLGYPVLLATPEVVQAYGGIQSVPTSLLIDRRGKVVKRWVGGLSQDVVAPELDKLL